MAIADELRKLHPGLEIDWLAQHPVTAVLEARGERIHPASAQLANESGHIESRVGGARAALLPGDPADGRDPARQLHGLPRRRARRAYDLWIGDEAWELDYYLHENPEQKRAAYVWLTDFVGWLPMPDGGEREAFLTADYNAEMIEHIARFPRVRDRAIFVGDPDDIVPDAFGPGLPLIRDWTEAALRVRRLRHRLRPARAFADRERCARARLRARTSSVCVVTVGGSGVGASLLRRVIAAFPAAKERIPNLRMIVVAGPRIDPATLPAARGLEVRPTSTTSTGTSRPAIWRSCRAG